MTGLKYCDAGVFNVDDIDSTSNARENPLDFDFGHFLRNSPQWGNLEPRPKAKYEVSPDVKLDDYCRILEDFSIRESINSSSSEKLDLTEVIHACLGKIDEPTRNLFCIHSKVNPSVYYTAPVVDVAERLSRPYEYQCFPSIIIVTDDAESAFYSTRGLINAKNSAKNAPRNARSRGAEKHRHNVTVCNLENEVPDGPSLAEKRRKFINIIVGSAEKVKNYIESVTINGELELLKLSVMHIFVTGVEQFAKNSALENNCGWICSQFRISPTNFIFMYKYLKSKCKVATAQKKCAAMVRGNMFVEAEKLKRRELYSHYEYRLITSSDELADRLSAQQVQNGKENVSYDDARIVMQPIVQKVIECDKIIDFVKSKRVQENRTKSQDRKERVLIITKDSKTAIFVAMSLRSMLKKDKNYTVKKMIVKDPVEYMEEINYEFRWLNLGVLVIDWRSIHSVHRGTVDTVILFDAPERMFFETILDAEMANLISQNCVQLKLFIFVDQHADVMLMGQFAKHLEKHNRKAPQWFAALYENYVNKWRALNNERQIYVPPVLENAEQIVNGENAEMNPSNGYGIRLVAHETLCVDSSVEHTTKMSKLAEVLFAIRESRGSEKTVIFCGDDVTTRRTTMGMKLKHFDTCLFTSDMYVDSTFQAHQVTQQFLKTVGALAMCSYETFGMAKLPLVEHYVFFEFPKQMTQFPALLVQLNEEAVAKRRNLHIDVLVSNFTENIWLKALIMELDTRKIKVPEWLFNTAKKNQDAEKKQEGSQDNNLRTSPICTATTSSIVPTTSHSVTAVPVDNTPIPAARNTAPRRDYENFDPYNMKPNAEGKYVIPSRMITGPDEDNEDMETDSGDFEIGSDDDEHQYDYESHQCFDAADELEY